MSDRFADCRPARPSPTASGTCDSAAPSDEFIHQHPGGILALSSNGSDPRTAIVWASAASVSGGGGRLMAFRAVPDETDPNRIEEPCSSDDYAAGGLDTGSGFVPPTISRGRVYVPTRSGRVEVSGPVPPRECRSDDPSQAPPTRRM
ncbi:MAG: hypothetical protein U1F52_19705 [Burkholderiales bacterium]